MEEGRFGGEPVGVLAQAELKMSAAKATALKRTALRD
jgi:hypothetical protein